MPFDEVVGYLREQNVVAATKACLQRIHTLTTFHHGSSAPVFVPEHVNVRVYSVGSAHDGAVCRAAPVTALLGPLAECPRVMLAWAMLVAGAPVVSTLGGSRAFSRASR